MGRRLALFFDGTWNKLSDLTNVARLFEMVEAGHSFRNIRGHLHEDAPGDPNRTSPQIKYYHQGVGTRFDERIIGGAFGYGLSRNIKDGYHWLAQQYQPGDEIFIFGFSRGAYTARSLVGLMRKCGIPSEPDEALVKEAYTIYREKRWAPDGTEANAFKKTFSHHDGRVKFLGVWDTVGALGIPAHSIMFSKDYYTWHDTELSRMVEHAYHAVALDEHRTNFAATMWSIAKPPARGQKVEQRWFVGSHADVGGGYPDGTLHQIPLQWMMHKARETGLSIIGEVTVDGNAHLSPVHDSYKSFLLGLYDKLPWNYRYYRPFGAGVHEHIDESVWRRIDSTDGRNEGGGRYAPPAMHSAQRRSG